MRDLETLYKNLFDAGYHYFWDNYGNLMLRKCSLNNFVDLNEYVARMEIEFAADAGTCRKHNTCGPPAGARCIRPVPGAGNPFFHAGGLLAAACLHGAPRWQIDRASCAQSCSAQGAVHPRRTVHSQRAAPSR